MSDLIEKLHELEMTKLLYAQNRIIWLQQFEETFDGLDTKKNVVEVKGHYGDDFEYENELAHLLWSGWKFAKIHTERTNVETNGLSFQATAKFGSKLKPLDQYDRE